MVFFLIVIGILIVTSSLAAIYIDDGSQPIFVVFIIFFSVLFGVITAKLKEEDKPQPLDVYRGNTTLQVTYQDSIPIDSVVVFINK